MGTILIDDKEAQKSLSRTDKHTKTLGERLRGGIKTAAKWGTALVGAAAGAGAAMFGLVNKATQSADAIAKGAEKVGVSTDFYQEMDYWASQNGISHEQMEKAVGRFNQRLGQAVNGNDKYASALQELGVNLDDVREGTLSTEDAYAQSISTLSEMENEQDKVNLATELFGTRMARDLLPALNDGSLSIDEAREKAQELGLVLSEDQLQASEAFQDSWDSIKRSLGTAATQIGLELMPMFQTLMDWVIANLPAIRETISDVFGFFRDAISWVVEGLQNMITWLQTLMESNEETFNSVREKIVEIFTQVVEFLQEAWQNIREFWEETGQGLLENVIMVFTSAWETIETVLGAVWELIQTILGLILPFIQEKLAQLKAFWDEHGDAIMTVVQGAFSFIQGVIEFIMPILVAIIEGAWAIITSVFDAAVGIIMGIIDYFGSMLSGDFEGMKESAISIFESLWEGIKGIVEGAWDLLSGAFTALWEQIEEWFTDLGSDALSWGEDLIKGFWNGIKGMGSWISGKVSGFIEDKVPGPIKKVLGIASPSRLMMEYGEDTAEGLALGVEEKGRRLERVSESMANAMIPDAQINNNITNQHSNNNGVVETLLSELIAAVRENKDFIIDGKEFAKVTGDYTAEEGGTRVRRLERGLAT